MISCTGVVDWSSVAGSGAAGGRQRRVEKGSSLTSTAHKGHELRRRRRRRRRRSQGGGLVMQSVRFVSQSFVRFVCHSIIETWTYD